jgi:hypothetical protein
LIACSRILSVLVWVGSVELIVAVPAELLGSWRASSEPSGGMAVVGVFSGVKSAFVNVLLG